MVVCLEQGADLHMAQLMPLPLTVSCFSKIQIGCTFLVAAHLGSPGKRAIKRVCVCVCVCIFRFHKQMSLVGRSLWTHHAVKAFGFASYSLGTKVLVVFVFGLHALGCCILEI